MKVLSWLCAALLLAGCAVDPSRIPVPGTGVGGNTYPIEIEFANAMNLPARAKVLANGAQVGIVTETTVVQDANRGFVTVHVDVADGVQLPTSTRAELRQDTILGDIHVSLLTPPDGFGKLLGPGGVIPLAQTKPPVQIEDAMAAIATFIQGGAITKLQDIVNRLNATFPQDPQETARIAQVVGFDAIDLSRNLDAVDAVLDALDADATAVRDSLPVLSGLLTAEAVTHVTNAVTSIVAVVGVLGALGGVAHSLTWLAPLATAGDAAAKAFVPLAFTIRPLDLDAPSNLNLLVSLLRDKLIPWLERGAKIDVVAVRSGVSTDDQVDRIVAALRMIGAVR